MSSRYHNERRYKRWIELDGGGRVYTRKVIGQYGWYALYIKQVTENETYVSFRQEIYDEQGQLIEIHEKYPIDNGHQKIDKP